jgi:hypothetical protein
MIINIFLRCCGKALIKYLHNGDINPANKNGIATSRPAKVY